MVQQAVQQYVGGEIRPSQLYDDEEEQVPHVCGLYDGDLEPVPLCMRTA